MSFKKVANCPKLCAAVTAANAPAAAVTSFNRLFEPPSFSFSHTVAVRTRFSPRKAMSVSLTIPREMKFVTPSEESISASHSPHLFRTFFKASVTDISICENAASIAPEESINAALSCWTVIVPSDAIVKSCDFATPRLPAKMFAVSGACSSILFNCLTVDGAFLKRLVEAFHHALQ